MNSKMLFAKCTHKLLGALLLFSMNNALIAEELEIRKITPPNLSAKHLGKHILCYRPMRHEKPEMEIEVPDHLHHIVPSMKVNGSGEKIIINNYGHGGSGWTLGPGAADYVTNLLEKNCETKQLNKNTPVAVIGAGALGLFSALELHNRGYKDITIYAAEFDNLTSHNAGGLLAPVSMDNDPEFQKTIDQIGIDAYKFYKSIALKQNKQIPNGARIVPAYFRNRQESGLEPYVGKVMQPAKDVLVDFENGTTHQMVVYDDGIFMDTAGLMNSLEQYLKKSHIKFVKKKITNFTELKQNIIFNCTGLGAKQLANDDKLVSVQGHLVMLKNQDPRDINYMMLVYFDKGITKSNQKIKRSFYIFPKQLLHSKPDDIGVVGGTFVEGADNSTPNTEEFATMLDAARKFYGLNN